MTGGVNVVPITTEAENGFHLPEKDKITKLINEKKPKLYY